MRQPSERIITVLLADHQSVSRAGIQTLLASADDIKVVGEAHDANKTQQLITSLHPQILLLEIAMPDLHPVSFLEWLKNDFPEIIPLVFTSLDNDAHLAVVMDLGVAGFLCKNDPAPKLLDSIRRAANGEILFDSQQLIRVRNWREEVGNKLDGLTEQEHNILKLLAKGYDNNTIAGELQISVKTVSYHVSNLFLKLRVTNRQEAAIWALKYLSDDLE
jgi:NarL family two-component system response regulator LiaR